MSDPFRFLHGPSARFSVGEKTAAFIITALLAGLAVVLGVGLGNIIQVFE